MVKKILSLFLLMLAFIFVYSCTPKVPPKATLDTNQLRSLQVKEIDGDLDTCYRGSLFILQDEGWIIKTADKSNGIIQAESIKTKSSFGPQHDHLRTLYKERPNVYYFEGTRSGRLLFVTGMMWDRWEECNVTFEPWGEDVTKIRLSLIKKGFVPEKVYSQGLILTSTHSFPQRTGEAVIGDPTVYQNFFARLKKEVFRRQNLNK